MRQLTADEIEQIASAMHLDPEGCYADEECCRSSLAAAVPVINGIMASREVESAK